MGRNECIEHAVLALVESFCDVSDVNSTGVHHLVVTEADDAELLIRALDEVMYLVDARGLVAVRVVLHDVASGMVDVEYATAALDQARIVGPAPKGVTRHELQFERDGDTWRCNVVIDV